MGWLYSRCRRLCDFLKVSGICLKCAWVNFAHTNTFMTSTLHSEFIDSVQLFVETLFNLGLLSKFDNHLILEGG